MAVRKKLYVLSSSLRVEKTDDDDPFNWSFSMKDVSRLTLVLVRRTQRCAVYTQQLILNWTWHFGFGHLSRWECIIAAHWTHNHILHTHMYQQEKEFYSSRFAIITNMDIAYKVIIRFLFSDTFENIEKQWKIFTNGDCIRTMRDKI